LTFRKGNLIYIAARPGVGKTGLMISIAIAAARENKPVAIFSMEMTKEELMFRITAQIAQVEVERIMSQKPDEAELQSIHANLGKVEGLPIYIDDTPALSIFDFRAKATVLKEQYGIELIMTDYVQLMTTGVTQNKYGGSREQEISVISRGSKQVAKELNVPVVALSQLTREVEKRTDKRPQLSDLRDSGSLEQDADAVVFIYRPEYHHEYTDKNGNSTIGVAEIIISKNRNGKIANKKCRFISKFAQFTDWDTQTDIPHPDDRIEPQKQDVF
jgi:replicative DNA helicase